MQHEKTIVFRSRRKRRFWWGGLTLAVLTVAGGWLAVAVEVPANTLVGLPSKPAPLTGHDRAGALTNCPTALVLHQAVLEGYCRDDVDLDDVDAYFWHVFSKLPAEVRVYPSENYYYFTDHIAGREVRGNIRLAAGQREQGSLSFWYAETGEPASAGGRRLVGSKDFSRTDGVQLQARNHFTWVVTWRNRSVTFHLHRLPQAPPRLFRLRPREVFVMRTFDESGLQFFLLFNTNANYFFWVLNEEAPVPEHFDQLAPDLLVGRRTGFAFWVDGNDSPRKVLAAVRRDRVARNEEDDGPFDQLADNYAHQTHVAQWMERAQPSLKGRIDQYGYYTDTHPPTRVALANYGTYTTPATLIQFMERAKTSADPCQFISRGGGL